MWKLLALLSVHFVADFLLQPREMGKKKSSEPKWLAAHLAIQFTCFLLFGWKFALANALIHGIIDWNIWRLYKLSAHLRIKRDVEALAAISHVEGVTFTEDDKRDSYNVAVKGWQFWEDHWFYATIGLDQLLHMSTLVVLAFIL